jgi:hypothetical protein
VLAGACSSSPNGPAVDGGPRDTAASADVGSSADEADDASGEEGGAAADAACAGARVDGRCRVELARGLVHPYNLAVNATHLYWTTAFVAPAGQVMRAALAGGAPEVLWTGTGAHPNPHTIVLDETSVYWTDFTLTTGGILKMPLDGGTPVALAELQDEPHGLAVDGTSVYWTTYNGGQIRKTSKTPVAGGPAPVVELARARPSPNNIAVDDTFVYWTEFVAAASGGAVMRTRLDGSVSPDAPTTVAPQQDSPYGIVLDAHNLYWTNAEGGQVMKMPRTGGAPTPLATGQVKPFGLAVDGVNVYWSNYAIGVPNALGQVRRVPIAGGAWTELAEATSYAVAVDDTSVYWTTFESGGPDGGAVTGGLVLAMTPK